MPNNSQNSWPFFPYNGWPYYANPNAPSDFVPCSTPVAQPGTPLLFAAVAGTVPPFSPLVPGQQSINQTTNEQWFVNLSFAWQQTVGV